MTKRILVAMSGGVDSSTTAALLKEQGFSVEGITMKLSPGVCCDIASAQAVCATLGIPHRILDMQDLFEKEIVGNFIAEYKHGRTPNPCIRCNDLVKFLALLEHAKNNSFDALATGHYARVEQDPASSRYLLKQGLDPAKDQSYFLYRLTQDQLAHVLFPLGGLLKTDVRKLAAKKALPAAERPESQEVCFVPADDYRAFLKDRAPEMLRPGEIVMTDGTCVGKHDGIAFFTVGQRRGLGVAGGERLYVVRIEQETERVVLGKKAELDTKELLIAEPSFVSGEVLTKARDVQVKVRYRATSVPARIEPADVGRIRVLFDSPVAGVSPGQSAVFYEGDVVVGGGIIER